MIGILLAFFAAAAALFLSLLFPTGDISHLLALLFLTAGTFFLLATALLNILLLIPLQKAESKTTPRIIEIFNKDFLFHFYTLTFILFAILSFFAAYAVNVVPIFWQPYFFVAWLPLLGIAADFLRHFCKRTHHFFDPQILIKTFTSHSIEAINSEKNSEACSWIESLAEIGTKGIATNSVGLTIQAIDEIQNITNHFLKAIKSISHPDPQNSKEQNRGIDETHYVLFYIFQRFSMINSKAIHAQIEPVCHYLITVLGKISLAAAQCDITLTEAPLRCLGLCTLEAQRHHIHEVDVKGIYVLVEVAKRIIDDLDITYLELQTTFKTLLAQLESITKEVFKENRDSNILMLMHPFQQLKEIFQSPKCASHQDTPIILEEINRILSEFQALQTVMIGIPR